MQHFAHRDDLFAYLFDGLENPPRLGGQGRVFLAEQVVLIHRSIERVELPIGPDHANKKQDNYDIGTIGLEFAEGRFESEPR